MPTIHLTPLRDDHFEVLVIKDDMDEAASGRLLVYEDGGDTDDDRDAVDRLGGTWTSSSTDPTIGRGRVPRAAAGKRVVATQTRTDGPETRSAAHRLKGLPS